MVWAHIDHIQKKYNLIIIEDAAQSFGAKYKNKMVGTFGTAGCFSLHPLKSLGGAGDGGFVATNDKNLYEKIFRLRNHGQGKRKNQRLEKSKYEIWWTFGWPYETSSFMARMVFSGLFDRHPGIKIITHHLGGMVPYFEGRVGPGWDQLGSRTSDEDYQKVLDSLQKRPLEYFKLFYADTAVFGSKSATVCGLEFFGSNHVVFASDAPFDPEKGPMYIRETIRILDSLDITDNDRKKIYHGNAERLMNFNCS